MITIADLDKCMNIAELATKAKVTPATIRNWLNTGVVVGRRRIKLIGVKLGGTWVIPHEAFEKFVADCNPEATPVPESPAKRAARFARERAELLKMLGGEV
jgi:hypothetical protein